MAAAAPAATAPAAAATAPAAKLENPKSARGPHKEEPPKTSAEEDAAFLKTVVEACHTSTVNRACQALKWHVDSGALVTEACRALAALAQDNGIDACRVVLCCIDQCVNRLSCVCCVQRRNKH